VSKYISTIGVDFGVKPVKVAGQSIGINIRINLPPSKQTLDENPNNVGTRRAHDARDAGA